MKRVLKQDANFKDAYLGLGLYNYWRSHYTRHLSFLPFFPDKRKEGLAQIQIVANEGKFAVPLAHFSLAMIYNEQKQYKKAEKIYQSLINQYPKNVTFRILYANLKLDQKKYAQAISSFEKLQRQYPDFSIFDYFLGRALYYENKNLNRAESLFSQLLARHPSKNYQARATYYLGLIAEKRGDKIGAMKRYKEAHRLDSSVKAPLKRLVKLRREKS